MQASDSADTAVGGDLVNYLSSRSVAFL